MCQCVIVYMTLPSSQLVPATDKCYTGFEKGANTRTGLPGPMTSIQRVDTCLSFKNINYIIKVMH